MVVYGTVGSQGGLPAETNLDIHLSAILITWTLPYLTLVEFKEKEDGYLA